MLEKLSVSDIITYLLVFYEAAISVYAALITVIDKTRSRRRGAKRISEASLLLSGALGGALFMFVTMIIIRHKTKHPKFMLGLPAIIILHAAAAYLVMAGTTVPFVVFIKDKFGL